MGPLSGILCLLAWGFIILVPLYVSYSFSRSSLRQRFCDDVQRLHGTVTSKTSDWIEVQLPGTVRPIEAAYFTSGTHWFGKDTLELHFPLPQSGKYEFFVCCQCPSTRSLPPGWVSEPTQMGSWRAVIAAPNATALADSLSLGVVSFFGQFRQTMAPKSCRIAVEGDLVKFYVKQYSAGITDFTTIISLGNKLSQQIGMLVDGTIQLNESVEESDQKTCPICSCEVVNPRPCSRCNTPHCTECWSYNNYCCGVFSCGGSMK